MIDTDRQLIPIFYRLKLHKKGSRNIISIIYFRKLSRFLDQFSSTALVIDTMSNIALY